MFTIEKSVVIAKWPTTNLEIWMLSGFTFISMDVSNLDKNPVKSSQKSNIMSEFLLQHKWVPESKICGQGCYFDKNARNSANNAGIQPRFADKPRCFLWTRQYGRKLLRHSGGNLADVSAKTSLKLILFSTHI